MTNRTGSLLLVLVMAGGARATLGAQNYGVPLFTNPRISTGVRLHADAGRPSESLNNQDLTVVQGGVSFVIGPVGISAAAAANLRQVDQCASNQANCDINTQVSAGALALIKVFGGGQKPVSVSLFGGASTDLNAIDYLGVQQPKQLNIPLGVAIGYRIPLGVASLNVWGAPRINLTRFANCTAQQTICDESESNFRWAVGADLPVFKVISVRAAFDGGKVYGGESVNFMGVGVSLGFGGMR